MAEPCRPPPGPPPAINHFPFPSARGRTGAGGLRMSEKRGVVRVQYGVGLRPSFYIGSLGGASPTHSRHTSNSTTCTVLETLATEAAHCPQCEGHARARALLVLNPAGSTSSARSGFGGSLAGGASTPAHASTERYSKHCARTACRGGGRFPRTPFAVPQRFDGESALCSEDLVRLISHKPAATRLDLPGLASTLGMRRLSSPRPRSLMLHRFAPRPSTKSSADTLRIRENRRLGAAWCTSCSRAAECCASCSERRCAQHVR